MTWRKRTSFWWQQIPYVKQLSVYLRHHHVHTDDFIYDRQEQFFIHPVGSLTQLRRGTPNHVHCGKTPNLVNVFQLHWSCFCSSKVGMKMLYLWFCCWGWFESAQKRMCGYAREHNACMKHPHASVKLILFLCYQGRYVDVLLPGWIWIRPKTHLPLC